MNLFSQRNAPMVSTLRYDVPSRVRARLWAVIKGHFFGGRFHAEAAKSSFLGDLGKLLQEQYGFLARPNTGNHSNNSHAVLDHLTYCTDEQALDFVEACFRTYGLCARGKLVDEINQIFVQEGIGYKLSPYQGRDGTHGQIVLGHKVREDELPQFIKIDDACMNQAVVEPCLSILADPVYSTANAEMLRAFGHHRAGRHEDAITCCLAALESVLKTVCDNKGWPFNCEKDTYPSLVDACEKGDLFPAFYSKILKEPWTVRNTLSSSHGRGPTPVHSLDPAMAEHLLYVCAAHVILITRLARLGRPSRSSHRPDIS